MRIRPGLFCLFPNEWPRIGTDAQSYCSGAPGLFLVPTFGELLGDLGAEGRKVLRVAAGHEALVGDHLLVDQFPPVLRMAVETVSVGLCPNQSDTNSSTSRDRLAICDRGTSVELDQVLEDQLTPALAARLHQQSSFREPAELDRREAELFR